MPVLRVRLAHPRDEGPVGLRKWSRCVRIRWKLKDGTWVKLEAGNWIPDPRAPAVIVAIPKDKAHCPPGLAKKGCVPPGQQKKGTPPGHQKKGY